MHEALNNLIADLYTQIRQAQAREEALQAEIASLTAHCTCDPVA